MILRAFVICLSLGGGGGVHKTLFLTKLFKILKILGVPPGLPTPRNCQETNFPSGRATYSLRKADGLSSSMILEGKPSAFRRLTGL